MSIVTGGESGIGKATAIRFAEVGARVTCVDIDGESVAATAREIGDVALFLASDESSFVTGTVLVADGAMTAQ